jgi:DNA invertase Pin-like site-specific DNA recombinase
MARKSGPSDKTSTATSTTTTTPRAFGYVRVSSSVQIKGESLDTQKLRIKEKARQLKMPLVKIYEDPGVSASSIPLQKRPAGRELLQAIADKEITAGDVIIASRLDRMFRRAADTYRVSEIFKKKKISLRLLNVFGGEDLTGDGMARAFLGVGAVFAELESTTMGERIAESKSAQRARGLALGGDRPFGYKIGAGRKLIPHPKEYPAIQVIKRLRKKKKTLRKIAEHVRTQLGLPISHVTVGKVLKRP